jgi:hypothetical protein
VNQELRNNEMVRGMVVGGEMPWRRIVLGICWRPCLPRLLKTTPELRPTDYNAHRINYTPEYELMDLDDNGKTMRLKYQGPDTEWTYLCPSY